MNTRFIIGILVGVGLLVLGIARDTILPLVLGAALIVLCGARLVTVTRRTDR
ncbi:hypothetical protein [Streptomyces sp. UG1]|uniref:hypothetical protein n=1 Tax=Streptomyces sp. UG1 TaxID=3417652 RepID=UPI003CEADCB5